MGESLVRGSKRPGGKKSQSAREDTQEAGKSGPAKGVPGEMVLSLIVLSLTSKDWKKPRRAKPCRVGEPPQCVVTSGEGAVKGGLPLK
jgi:hypothetical protein